MNWASATMPASLSSLIASLFSSIVVSLRKRSSFSCAAASVPSETCTSPALRYSGSRSRSRRMSVTRVLMPHFTREVALDQFLAQRDELLAVDRRLLVGEDEEADLVLACTSTSISSTNLTGSRVRYLRQNFHCEQKRQVNGQPRAKFGTATRQLSGM